MRTIGLLVLPCAALVVLAVVIHLLARQEKRRPPTPTSSSRRSEVRYVRVHDLAAATEFVETAGMTGAVEVSFYARGELLVRIVARDQTELERLARVVDEFLDGSADETGLHEQTARRGNVAVRNAT